MISRWSIDLPGARFVPTAVISAFARAVRLIPGEEFANIVLLTNPDGSKLRLKDVASINDGFVEWPGYAYFNGAPAMMIEVKSTANESELQISEAVKRYIDTRQDSLPDSVYLNVWGDSTRFLSEQLTVLLKEYGNGVALVFVVLAVFFDSGSRFGWSLGCPLHFRRVYAVATGWRDDKYY